ncbi:ATP-dependent helicase HrpA [Pseudarthrobacter phenanthrenivorans Sphe3]|uniref:ATP-dependent helicase HrpA n=1 Tax=Pseudarthrobacter phenanthrenivorans (strain DSM 18606 / JCM 16027 / LMG 23796 / Sphe3) TaxID=930171 RepID=F0M6N9_PSEPM|nr:ATP-dependent RNA helicase HrpA [Pseudarthrobacter phenanthrenivorans]ADX73626.1 ATP-dependent helicase HrpA [Pseudarthrobacter phenanthrenivorans Sphe3]
MTLHISYPAELPVSERRDDLMAAIAANQVTIIAGETGSGKTTQIPKMCLELGLGENGLIGHTQPRRLAARTVAERIAEELDVEIGQEVGFQVRFTGEVSRATKIKLMTDGILLAEIQRDKLLRKYNAIIIDEAHERSLNIDFILGYLKRILPQRPDLKVIITSATIDPERFANHFGTPENPAPIVEVSGRTYPVEIRYRPLSQPPAGTDEENASDDELEEDRDPLDAVCDAVDELATEAPGDILVFFSGEREIRDAAEALQARIQSNKRLAGTEVLPLFARLSLQEQHKVFHPGNKRRIVLATNVAETSLTVPGIKYVVDTGTARISRYSHRTKVQRLPIERVSQASANQRSGRCGRVSDGIAIRLYSEEDFESRPRFTDPEILRTNLAAVILQMTAMGVARGPKDVEDFPFVEPPETRAINDGVTLLRELGALAAARQQDGKAGAKSGGGLTAVGQKLAQLPVDPRLGRMIVEAGKRGCVREVMILAAALTIQDPRERPTDKQQLAAEKHNRFKDENSDFTGFLNLWNYLQEKQQELSSSAFRRLCRAEFINYLRVREWQDLFAQLRQLARPLGISLDNKRLADPVGNHDGIHISLLSGLLSHIGILDERKREYAGARGSRFAIFPGSALFKKSPTFVMAAELVETSRLWARVAARFDPLWAEQVAPDLVKRSYSEPHWSTRQGSVMAYEKVTLYGVPIIAQRRINYGPVDPVVARELFIRHALVEGDWKTHHKFFHRNRALLSEVEELEARMRRRDLMVDDETLFEFYDARIGPDVVSERHFDKWWKEARQKNPDLLDYDKSLLLNDDAEDLDEAAYPKTWLHKGFELPLSYEFHPVAPGSPPDPSDGVTAEVPVLFLNQLEDKPFRWLIPGQRVELVTALIKSLPKQVRKNFVPAPDVARQAVAMLESDFDPAVDDLEPSLELALRRLRGQIVPPGSWNWDAVPPHLRVSFKVVDSRGKVLGEGKDLAALQEELAPATRRAIAESLGATPATTGPGGNGRNAPRAGTRTDDARSSAGRQAAARSTAASPGFREQDGLTEWSFGTLERQVSSVVKGHTVTGYPALVDQGKSVSLRVFQTPAEQSEAMRGGVIRLLALRVPAPDRYVLEHLSNTEKLTFSQNPHGSVSALIADCVLAAIDKLTPAELPWDRKSFDALYEVVRAELIDTVFAVTAVVERILASTRRIEKQLKGTTSLALISALNDIKSQLEQLVYPGFVARTGYAQLSQFPRYLAGIEKRLERLPGNVQRDALNMAVIQGLEDDYDDAVSALLPGRKAGPELTQVRWMLEELRVSLFAVELGTAYPVSEKRIRAVLNKALAPA